MIDIINMEASKHSNRFRRCEAVQLICMNELDQTISIREQLCIVAKQFCEVLGDFIFDTIVSKWFCAVRNIRKASSYATMTIHIQWRNRARLWTLRVVLPNPKKPLNVLSKVKEMLVFILTSIWNKGNSVSKVFISKLLGQHQ